MGDTLGSRLDPDEKICVIVHPIGYLVALFRNEKNIRFREIFTNTIKSY